MQELLIQKVTPNIYVFNSLMNANAHDVTYTLDVYKQMKVMSLLPSSMFTITEKQ